MTWLWIKQKVIMMQMLEHRSVSSPSVSSAWCSEHNTTPVVGRLLLYRSPAFCDSPGGTDYDTPDTPPAGSPLSPSFVWGKYKYKKNMNTWQESSLNLNTKLSWWKYEIFWWLLSAKKEHLPADYTGETHFHGKVISISLIGVIYVW